MTLHQALRIAGNIEAGHPLTGHPREVPLLSLADARLAIEAGLEQYDGAPAVVALLREADEVLLAAMPADDLDDARDKEVEQLRCARERMRGMLQDLARRMGFAGVYVGRPDIHGAVRWYYPNHPTISLEPYMRNGQVKWFAATTTSRASGGVEKVLRYVATRHGRQLADACVRNMCGGEDGAP